jgi:hypothetical protein
MTDGVRWCVDLVGVACISRSAVMSLCGNECHAVILAMLCATS